MTDVLGHRGLLHRTTMRIDDDYDRMLPLMAGLLVAAIVSGRAISRMGRYKIFPIAGTAVLAVGMYLLSLLGVGTASWLASAYMLVVGVGIGLVMQVLVPWSRTTPRPRTSESPPRRPRSSARSAAHSASRSSVRSSPRGWRLGSRIYRRRQRHASPAASI